MKHYTPGIPKLRIYFSADKEYTQNVYAIKRTVRDAVRATLYHERFDADAEISVTFCTNESIRALNREHREKDASTDVLSFPIAEDGDLEEAFDGEKLCLGDIVLSLERAREQANEFGHPFEREVAFLCVHSTLHLLGYDHETGEEDEADMRARQREIMKIMGLEVK